MQLDSTPVQPTGASSRSQNNTTSANLVSNSNRSSQLIESGAERSTVESEKSNSPLPYTPPQTKDNRSLKESMTLVNSDPQGGQPEDSDSAEEPGELPAVEANLGEANSGSQAEVRDIDMYDWKDKSAESGITNENHAKLTLSAINARIPTNRFAPTLKYGNYDYKRVFPLKADHKYIRAGQSFLAGFGTRPGETFFNPEIGLGYEKVLNAFWSVNAQVSYFNVSGIAHVAEFEETALGFGYNTTLTRIQTNKLHFAYLPVQMNWDFNRRNSLTAGAGVSYLINGLSLVTVSEVDNFSSTELDRFEEWGYIGGYKPINLSLLAGYEFRITPDWTFGLQYQYGLSEITKSDIYGQSREDRNSRLRATLKYAIWR